MRRPDYRRKSRSGAGYFRCSGCSPNSRPARRCVRVIFGYTAERKMERALIGEYRDTIRAVAAKVTPETLHTAVEIAAAPDLIAGYGPVKEFTSKPSVARRRTVARVDAAPARETIPARGEVTPRR
ncbi:MAG: DUF6537 domain-containing protein [Sphingomonadaceae bacterium]